MDNFIIVAVILLIIGAAVIYIIKEKKHGVKCIGCPAAGECASRNSGAVSACSGCSGHGKCAGNCSSCHSGIK